MGEETVVSLARAARRLEVRRRDHLWHVGDAATELWFVRSGVVRRHFGRASDDGVIVAFSRRGDAVDVGRSVAGEDRADAAVAHRDVVAFGVPRRAVQAATERDPELQSALLRRVIDETRRAERRLSTILGLPAPARVAAGVLQLAEDFGVRDSRGVIVDLRLTHRDLAAWVGTTRETVSHTLAALRRRGLLMTERQRVVIVDSAGLAEQARAGRR